jgi:hypothetical protein
VPGSFYAAQTAPPLPAPFCLLLHPHLVAAA